ncbi:hypothetical protein TNCT_367021 [Trichonephila clavata]|uniref:Uncharacterized protein n=1 Tax=Trichonephila clavata TaxID=2740835 RepID=A0A8X6KD30_TRICU|nr:hypothetical protein TNCT_367021 [Trichonephila clavata]
MGIIAIGKMIKISLHSLPSLRIEKEAFENDIWYHWMESISLSAIFFHPRACASHSRFPNVIKLEDCFVYCHSLSVAFTADLSRFPEFPIVIKVYNFVGHLYMVFCVISFPPICSTTNSQVIFDENLLPWNLQKKTAEFGLLYSK